MGCNCHCQEPSGCTAKVDRNDDPLLEGLNRYEDAKCFDESQLGLNIIRSLEKINGTLEEIQGAMNPAAIPTAALQFEIGPGGGYSEELPAEAMSSSLLMFSCPLNYKIVGIGIYMHKMSNSTGTYATDDTYDVQLWNNTIGAGVGPMFMGFGMSKRIDKITNSGQVVAPDLNIGHVLAFRIIRHTIDGGQVPEMDPYYPPTFRVILHVQPTDLIPTI